MRWLGRLLLRIPAARKAVRDGADLERFRRPMDRKLRVGLLLLALGMLTGWPAVALLAAMALVLKEPWILALGGPMAYALSWIVWGVGVLVAGIASLAYLQDVNRWLLRRLVEGLFGGPGPAREAVQSLGPPPEAADRSEDGSPPGQPPS